MAMKDDLQQQTLLIKAWLKLYELGHTEEMIEQMKEAVEENKKGE